MASPASIGLHAQNSILSKNSLAIVQGEVYSPPCPCMRQSVNAFTASWLKMASLAGIGLHPILRIIGSFAKDFVNRFSFGRQLEYFVQFVRVF